MVKRTGLLLFVCLFISVSSMSAGHAFERAPLWGGHFGVKLDYIKFTDSVVKDLDVDEGTYFGIDGYGNIGSGFYLGGELGWAYASGLTQGVNTQLYLIPFEINLKYAAALSRAMVFDVGAGLSANYVDQGGSVPPLFRAMNAWLLGGQVFVGLNYRGHNWFFGINGKYQATDNFRHYDFSYDNWRVGFQFGGMWM